MMRRALERLKMAPTKRQAVAAALVAARIGGCTCDPDIRITAESGAGDYSIGVAHDDWCEHFRNTPEQSEAMDHAVRALGRKQ